ncbi:MAG: hypothetical protein QXH68_01045 [Candidatus Aenigmatarchaeota archaeon]
MANEIITYLILLSILSLIIGALESLILFIFSSNYFISKEMRKILKNLFLSIFFILLYFISNILSLFFYETQISLYVALFQTIFAIIGISFLIYTSILIYNFALELGFQSPKNKRKIERFLKKE